MLATPRNSITSINPDVDVDDLLAEGKAAAEAAISTKAVPPTQHTTQGPQSDITSPMKSIGYEKYVEDIEEWLVMTNFYDDGYRQKTLARHRRLKAIEREKQQLLREEQEELQKYCIGAEGFPVRSTPAAPEPTPAPEITTKQDRSRYSPPPARVEALMPSKESQKRSHDEIKDEPSEQELPAKILRRQSLERFQIEPLKHTPPRGPANKPEQRTTEQQQHQYNSDNSHRCTRPDLFGGYNTSNAARNTPDTRYFHIRSWNHENVWAAQQDCTWVTQKTNEMHFTEAFEQSRRVILFFSVNNSKAFQGIAEMGSIPGAPGLPNPAWRSRLHWPATDAFALIWLLKQDVPHNIVRHLRNPLNENLPAHVGTDGVEIDTWIGEQMFSILHDYARRSGHP